MTVSRGINGESSQMIAGGTAIVDGQQQRQEVEGCLVMASLDAGHGVFVEEGAGDDSDNASDVEEIRRVDEEIENKVRTVF